MTEEEAGEFLLSHESWMGINPRISRLCLLCVSLDLRLGFAFVPWFGGSGGVGVCLIAGVIRRRRRRRRSFVKLLSINSTSANLNR